ncbi:MAG: hypothetical protein ACREBE_15735 [bacterium]
MGDTTKKTDQSNTPRSDKVDELPQKPIADTDAQSVKGGVANNKWEKK